MFGDGFCPSFWQQSTEICMGYYYSRIFIHQLLADLTISILEWREYSSVAWLEPIWHTCRKFNNFYFVCDSKLYQFNTVMGIQNQYLWFCWVNIWQKCFFSNHSCAMPCQSLAWKRSMWLLVDQFFLFAILCGWSAYPAALMQAVTVTVSVLPHDLLCKYFAPLWAITLLGLCSICNLLSSIVPYLTRTIN